MQSNRFRFNGLYFPGLISLVGLPLLLLSYIFYNGIFLKQTMLNVVWFDDNVIMLRNNRPIPSYSFGRFLTDKKSQVINLTGDEKKNTMKIDVLGKLIRLIKKNRDLKTTYKVSFNEHTKYASMVYLLDLCQLNQDSGFIYIPYKNNIYLYYIGISAETNNKKRTLMPCGGIINLKQQQVYPETILENGLNSFTKDILSIWLALIFLCLMLLSANYHLWFKSHKF